MLIGGVIEDQFGDDAQTAPMRLAQECLEICQCAVHRIHRAIIGNVITIIFERRGIKREQPDGGHPEVFNIIELLGQAAKIPGAVAVTVVKRADMDFVDDAALIQDGSRLRPSRWIVGLVIILALLSGTIHLLSTNRKYLFLFRSNPVP